MSRERTAPGRWLWALPPLLKMTVNVNAKLAPQRVPEKFAKFAKFAKFTRPRQMRRGAFAAVTRYGL
jgi:hypothetical protein